MRRNVALMPAMCVSSGPSLAQDVNAIMKAIKDLGICVYANQIYSNGSRICMSEGYGAICRAPSIWEIADEPNAPTNVGCKSYKPAPPTVQVKVGLQTIARCTKRHRNRSLSCSNEKHNIGQ